VALTGVGPYWDYSREWGYTPSGFVFALFLVLLVLLIMRGRP
jgi:hypothetical protein